MTLFGPRAYRSPASIRRTEFFCFYTHFKIRYLYLDRLEKCNIMTEIAIQEQIATIKNATKKASASKETAIKFLTEAGILKAGTTKRSSRKK